MVNASGTSFLSNAIMVVTNRHIKADTSPPCLKNAPTHYLSYFENAYGEQWIFTHERGTDHFTLTGGDIGWESVSDLSDLTLSVPEQTWVVACIWACGLEDSGKQAIEIFESQKRQLKKAISHGRR